MIVVMAPVLPLAACRDYDPEWWFPRPEDEHGQEAKMAKAICRVCPERIECLAGAIARDEPTGIWGGKSSRERQSLLRRAKSLAV